MSASAAIGSGSGGGAPAAPVSAPASGVLPSGGQFTSGSGAIESGGGLLTVTQTTDAAIIAWNDFSIGTGGAAHFDNGAGATLNRVTGLAPSRIDGTLTATGSLYLVNEAGVVVGSNGLVATGGSFVASTHDVSDGEFLAGGAMDFRGASTASVVNLGAIESAQGDVVMIARRVENSGRIEARQGRAALAAGYEVTLSDAADGALSVKIGGADTEAVNAGDIVAATVEMRAQGGNVYALAGNTDAVIKAQTVRREGGRIFLSAGEGGSVQVAGALDASGETGGVVDVAGQTISVSGRIDVSAAEDGGRGGDAVVIAAGDMAFSGTIAARGGEGGEGGFVETSGKQVTIADSARVDTRAEGGATGDWLIDPTDLHVGGPSGDITSATVQTNLFTTNVTLDSDDGGSGVNGDIFINDDIMWVSGNTLTLDAVRNIVIGRQIRGANGGLTINAGGTITTAAFGTVNVETFTLNSGDWRQVDVSPASFAADEFQIDRANASFLRAVGGDGSSGDPYKIEDLYGLQGIASESLLSSHFVLTRNINASSTAGWNGGAGFMPIGNNEDPADIAFSGSFDGQGYTISGLTINRPGEEHVGLFGFAENAAFSNLVLSGGSITGGDGTGSLIGQLRSGSITSVSTSTTVTGAGFTGGLAGIAQNGTITLASASGDVTGSGAGIGGLAGVTLTIDITQSSASGDVSGAGRVGGLLGTLGYASGDGTLDQSFATGAVTSTRDAAGGLVGHSEGAITNSYAMGAVTGTGTASYIGGFIGENSGSIDSSYSTGLVTGPSGVGGFVGIAADGDSVINSAYWNTETSGQSAGTGIGSGAGGVTGLTTAQLQANRPTGFDAVVWGEGEGLYPYLTDFYAVAPTVISGFVYGDAGVTPLAGASVDLLSGGAVRGEGSSGANGYYYITVDSTTVMPTGVLAYLNNAAVKGIAATDIVTADALGDLDIFGDTVRIDTQAASVDATGDNLDAMLGSIADADLDILEVGATLSTDNGASLILNTASDYIIDRHLVSQGSLTASTGGAFAVAGTSYVGATGGALTLNGDMAWSDASHLYITGANIGDVVLNGAVNAPDGQLTINATSTLTNATTTTSTGAIDVGVFTLSGIDWLQVGAGLPDFTAADFRVTGAAFIRALGGDGSVADPYQLFDVYGLQGIYSEAASPLNYVLAQDIDASGTAAWNGGAGFAPVILFGNFDGAGHTIDGLTVNRPTQTRTGLFERILASTRSITVKDLTLTNVDITGLSNASGLAGLAQVTNGNTLTLSGITVDGAVSGHDITGGMIGQLLAPTGAAVARDLHADVQVTATGEAVGGLIGQTGSNLTISDSSATGDVSGVGNVGGLVGYTGADVIRSFATGNVSSSYQRVGGLIGYAVNGSVDLTYATGTVTNNGPGAIYTGGLIGELLFTPVSRSYASGDVVSDGDYAGGLIGRMVGGLSDVENVYALGAVTADNYAGGLIGYLDGGSVSSAYSTGVVTATTSAAGGSVGRSDDSIAYLNVYWDRETSGQFVAAGQNDDSVDPYIFSQTTAQLQGTLPDGFDAGVWSTGPDLYPYLSDLYVEAPSTIAGFVYRNAGSTAVSGADVSILSGGSLIASVTSAANGYYYYQPAPGETDAAGVLSFLDGESIQGAAFTDILTEDALGGMDIWADFLKVTTGASGLTGTLGNLTTAIGAFSDSDLDFIDTGATQLTANGYGIYLEAESSYLLNRDLTSGLDLFLHSAGDFSIDADRALTAAGGGSLVLGDALAWGDASVLTLTADDLISITKGIDAPNGGLTLSAGGRISPPSTQAINLAVFTLNSGFWRQIEFGSMPLFTAADFRIDPVNATFLRAFRSAMGADGSVARPYRIVDIYGLQGMASESLLSSHFVLEADIDASGTAGWNDGAGFLPIGIDGVNHDPLNGGVGFTASFDGGNHAISGLTIDREDTSLVGLFGYASNESSLSNLVLQGGEITGYSAVGSLAGQVQGTISNVHSSSVVNVGAGVAGGLVGAGGSIFQSSATGAVNAAGAATSVGGLAGTAFGTVDQSYATGNVTVGGAPNDNSDAGGLVGSNDGTISRSFATGSVSMGGNVAGGLVGHNSGQIINSYATGAVAAGDYAGGLAGINNGSIASSYSIGTVTTTTYDSYGGALGQAGFMNEDGQTYLYWDIETSGTTDAVGYNFADSFTGIEGKTTAELQSVLPEGFDSSVWGTGEGLYPYLKAFHATAPTAISGFAYGDAGVTPLVGASVNALSGGALIGGASSLANGYYYILTDTADLDPAGVLTFLDGEADMGAAFSDMLTNAGLGGMDIWANWLNVRTGEAAMTDTFTNLVAVRGGYGDSDVTLYGASGTYLSTGNGISLSIDAASDYLIDAAGGAHQALTLTSGGTFGLSGDRSWFADNGELIINGDIAWADSATLNLYARLDDLTLNGGVSAANGVLDLDTASDSAIATATGDIGVGTFQTNIIWRQIGAALPAFSATDFQLQGRDFLRAAGGDGSIADPYQLFDVYGLQGIRATSAAPKNYVLTADIDASGTAGWNAGAGFRPVDLYGNFDGGGFTIDGLTINASGLTRIGLFSQIRSYAQAITVSDLNLTNVDMSGGLVAGGLAAYIREDTGGPVTLSDITVTGTVTGSITAGGMVGSFVTTSDANLATRLHADVQVTAQSDAAGGLIAFTGPALTVSDSSAEGDVSGKGAVGGLIGSTSGSILRSYATGAVSLDNGATVGGLVGRLYDGGSVDLSYATGDVTHTNGGANVGGLIGWNDDGAVTRSFATGDVTTIEGYNVGGLIGRNSDGTIENSYATGSVSAASEAGGLVGDFASGSITDSYATGSVTSAEAASGGGVAGSAGASGTALFSGVFWDTQTTGQADGIGAGGDGATGFTGLTTAQLRQLSTFTDAGWSIDDEGGTDSIWRIYDGATGPLLRGFLTDITVTADDKSKTYDGAVFGGEFTYTKSDPAAVLQGGVGGPAATAVNAGTYTIGSELYSDQFGYDIAFNAGTLTINAASLNLTVTPEAASKTYGDLLTLSAFEAVGLQDGDSIASVTLTSAGTAADADVGTYDIAASDAVFGSGSASNYNITYSVLADGLTVTARTLTLGLTGLVEKIYDGDADATLTLANYSGFDLLFGDTVSLTGFADGSYNSDARDANKMVSVTGLGLSGADSDNYVLASDSVSGQVGLITPKTLTFDFVANDKVYTGTTITTGTLANLDGVVDGDVFGFSGDVAFETADAGDDKVVNYENLALHGLDAGNYQLFETSGQTTANITPRALTITANDDSKIYDGNAYSGGNGVSYSGFINGENASDLSGSLTYGGTAQGAVDAGTYSIIAGGLTSNNYAITFDPGTLIIDPASLNLTITPEAASKIYGEILSLTDFDVTGLQGSDSIGSVTLTSGGTAADADVGAYDITPSDAVFSSGSASNYNIVYQVLVDGLTVTPRGLIVTADDLARIYGDANPALTYVLGGAGLVNGDTLSGSLATDANTTSDVGLYDITQGTLTAGDNYALTFNAGELSITPRGLIVTADDLARIYGNANPALTYVLGGAGLVNGDVLSGDLATAADATSDVGQYDITQGTLSAGDNYALTFNAGELSITPRGLIVTADDLARIYGNANPALDYTLGGAGLVNGDTLSGDLATAADATSDVGQYDITQGSLSAGDNYALTFNAGELSITPRGLIVTADDLARIYGEANPALDYTLGGAGLVNGDTLSGSLATDADATSDVGLYDITQGSLSAGDNYALTFNAGELSITPRGLVVTADDLARIYGDANPALTYALGGAGLVNGDTLSGELATAADSTSDVGLYDIIQGTLTAGDNYSLTFNAGELSITPRGLIVTADDLARIYGDANPALTYALAGAGLVNGDTLSGELATAADSTSDVGQYDITQGSLSAGDNYALTFNAGELSVTPRGLIVTADDLARIYGDANPALTYVLAGAGLVNGDTLSGELATTADATSDVGVYDITQGTLSAGDNYALTFNAGELSITPRGLIVTADDLARIYGEANPALDYTLGGAGLVNGDTLSGALATDADATSDVGLYDITQGTLTAGDNYALTFNAGELSITPRGLIVTADDLARIYGDANPALTYALGGAGLVNGDTLSGELATAADATSDVGVFDITQGTLTAGDNYALTFDGGELSVTPRGLIVTADDLSRIYGDANPALTYVLGGAGLVNGDTLSGELATTADATSDVGLYDITQGSLTAGDNYALTFNAGELSVTPRGLIVTADDLARIYGDANPALTYVLGGAGLVNGDVLSGDLATTADATSDVGVFDITQGTLTADDNYALTFNAGELSVTPRGLVVTADDLSRIYGDANPALTYMLGGAGLVNGDTLSGSLATTANATFDVGVYDITQGTLSAGDNYALTFNAGELSITPRGLIVTADDLSRIYGDANPALTYVLGGMGLVNGDTLSGALATDADAMSDVGIYDITQGSLTAGGNYDLTFNAGELSITPRGLIVTADDLSRIYGAANPALTYALGGMGLVNGDALSGSLATTADAASDVGSYAISQGTLSAGGNYALTFNGGELTVTPRGLIVTADDLSRIYGDANPALTYVLGGDGLVNGDTLSGSLATAADETSDVGAYGVTQGTLSASGNYAMTFNAGALTVTPRGLVVTADDLSRIYGEANPALTYALGGAGLVNGDTLGGSLATTADQTSDVGTYGIAQGTLSAGGNYAITFNGGDLTVSPRGLTVTADDLSRNFGEDNPVLTYLLGGMGLVNGDMLSGSLATPAGLDSNPGDYAIGLGDLTAGGNYQVTFNPGVLTVRPTAPADPYLLETPASTPSSDWDGVLLEPCTAVVMGGDALTSVHPCNVSNGLYLTVMAQ